jgi:hypothetical protein
MKTISFSQPAGACGCFMSQSYPDTATLRLT